MEHVLQKIIVASDRWDLPFPFCQAVYQDRLRKEVINTNAVATVPFRSLISLHHHTGSVVPTLTLKNLNIQVCLCTAGNTSTVLPHLAPGKTFSSSVYAQHNDVLSHLLTSPGTFTLILLCGFTFLPIKRQNTQKRWNLL